MLLFVFLQRDKLRGDPDLTDSTCSRSFPFFQQKIQRLFRDLFNRPGNTPYIPSGSAFLFTVIQNKIQFQIFQIVKENCSVEFSGNTPHEDAMELLLRSRMGQKRYS